MLRAALPGGVDRAGLSGLRCRTVGGGAGRRLPEPVRRGVVRASGAVQAAAVACAVPLVLVALPGPLGWAAEPWSGAPSDARAAVTVHMPWPPLPGPAAPRPDGRRRRARPPGPRRGPAAMGVDRRGLPRLGHRHDRAGRAPTPLLRGPVATGGGDRRGPRGGSLPRSAEDSHRSRPDQLRLPRLPLAAFPDGDAHGAVGPDRPVRGGLAAAAPHARHRTGRARVRRRARVRDRCGGGLAGRSTRRCWSWRSRWPRPCSPRAWAKPARACRSRRPERPPLCSPSASRPPPRRCSPRCWHCAQ